mgnify:CR=1 FL=1
MLAEQTIQPVSMLVIADSNFINLCKNPDEYMTRLKEALKKRREQGVDLYTVSGRYGLGNIDKELITIDVQDKNKTIFMQTLENNAPFFDELLILSVAPEDNYINAAREVMTQLNKSFTHYRYDRKQ